jgi:hypothetical protein
MSIDINWDTLTGGADGTARAETIRAFIHDKFQQVTLPRFIRSVHVHSFDFGSASPEIEIKDICDPLPDFYEATTTTTEVMTSMKQSWTVTPAISAILLVGPRKSDAQGT